MKNAHRKPPRFLRSDFTRKSILGRMFLRTLRICSLISSSYIVFSTFDINITILLSTCTIDFIINEKYSGSTYLMTSINLILKSRTL